MANGVPNTWRAEHGYCQAIEDPAFAGVPPPPYGVQFAPMPYPVPVPQPQIIYQLPVLQPQMPIMYGPGPAPGFCIPPPAEVEKKEKKKSQPSTKAPGAKPGFSYLYPNVPSISIHLFPKGTPANALTDGKSYHNLETTNFTVANSTTLNSLVSMLGMKEKAIVYHVHEAGDGRWKKGMRYYTDTDIGNKTLEQVGWIPDKPVWLVIEKPKK